jgi:hypothetical protein
MLIAQAQRETYLQCQVSLTIGRDKVCLGHSQYFLGENFKRVDVPGQGAYAGGIVLNGVRVLSVIFMASSKEFLA